MNLTFKSPAWFTLPTLIALVLGHLSSGQVKVERPPKNVLLISVDTLRADHCGFLGYDKPTTPFIDELAASGVVFEDHRVHSNNTLLSHSSILTGTVPVGAGGPEGAAGEDAPGPHDREGLQGRSGRGQWTLAESFQTAGYTTAAFTGHPVWLGSDFGLDQGFDVHESDWVLAPETTRRFLDWYDEARPERMFCFLHFYDVHAEAGDGPGALPYESTPELIAQFAGPRPAGWTGRAKGHPDHTASRYLDMITYGIEKLGPGHLEYVIGLYDAGLRKLDDDLRVLFGELARRGVLDDSMVILTSDHGEAFLEHGQMLHGGHHDEIMRVPLIVIPPAHVKPFSRRIGGRSRAIDIAPTLLDFVGIEPAGTGRSLLPAIVRGEPLGETAVLFSSEEPGAD